MFGKIEFENFEGLTKMPQEAASAWSAAEGLVGASYKPLLYAGSQAVHGTLHWFIAEQTLVTATPEKRLVTIAINEVGGDYSVVGSSIKPLPFELSGTFAVTLSGIEVTSLA